MAGNGNKANIIDKAVPDDSVCTLRDVITFTGLSRNTVLKMIKSEKLPKPLDLGLFSGSNAPYLWRVGDIRDWGREHGIIKGELTVG